MDISKPVDHNKIITKSAKEVLAPLGCIQKGRSRFWYDDHGWFTIIVEFQPSGFGRGSYLNVGVTWLWVAKDYWAFDEGGRVEDFIEYRDETTFLDSSTFLAKRAAEEVQNYRKQFTNIKTAADYFKAKKNKNDWGLFNAAIACELAGYSHDSRKYFSELIYELQHPGFGANMVWIYEFLSRVKELEHKLSQPDEFRARVIEIIQQSQMLHKLEPIQNPLEYYSQ